MSWNNQCEALVGKTVAAVDLAEDKKALRFVLADGGELVYLADGDCCSRTWVESLDDPAALLATVRATEDLNLPRSESNELKYYGVQITTDKGRCVIDYRNESNGYYGGNLVLEGDPDGYFYGGVFDQNVSQKVWRRVAG